MANKVVSQLGYTGTVGTLTWTQGITVPVRAYLWGGGGGGGGNDSGAGGEGSGAGFSLVDFTVNAGDIIQVAVGGSGGPGSSGQKGQGAGSAGSGLVTIPVFNIRTAVSSPEVYDQFNSNFGTFLNTYGVWESNKNAQNFDRTYVINVPSTTLYTFVAAVSGQTVIEIDGVPNFSANNAALPFTQPVNLTAGSHTIRIRATRSTAPGSVALTISTGQSYSGARGGNAGTSGTSGGGGGSGGATVLLVNNVVIGVAGGGGGGGGGGNTGVATGQSAPGPNGRATNPTTNGQNGTNKTNDGGGGGGGGGGYDGGNGGQTPGGDIGGQAGSWGSSYSVNGSVQNPTGRTAAGVGQPYYSSARGQGGVNTASGTTGFAALEFGPLNGLYVHTSGNFTEVQSPYAKVNGIWTLIKNIYVKQNGVWNAIIGSFSPVFESVEDSFGVNPREATGDSGGGGGGGSCVVSTAFTEQGIWNTWQKDELIAWCEDKLHNRVLGECFRRGYQVVGSKALHMLKTSWGRSYAKWAFDNGTRMVRGRSFSWWSVPNSVLWISAFMLVGSVVTTKYANRCWKSAPKQRK